MCGVPVRFVCARTRCPPPAGAPPAVSRNTRGRPGYGFGGGREGPGKDWLNLSRLLWKDVKLCSCVRRRTAGKALDSREARVGGVKLCLPISMENTLLYIGDGGAVKLFSGENGPGKRGAWLEQGTLRGVCLGFPFGLRKPKGLSGQRLAGAAPARRRAQGEDVSLCARARCKYESNFPVFFLPLCLRRRWPRGSGRPARAEVEGPGWS